MIPGHRPAVVAFDAYGTLFDLASGLRRAFAVPAEAAQLLAVWRTQQLEYTWLRTLMGHYADFGQVTAEALDSAMARLQVNDDGLRRTLLASYERLSLYPDVLPLLETMACAGQPAVILSNGTPAMLEASARHAGIRHLLHGILSADAVGKFKPAPEVYALVPDAFRVPPEEVLFVSANAWDVAGAATFGLSAVWVNRTQAPPETLPGAAAGGIADLRTLSRYLGLEPGDVAPTPPPNPPEVCQ